VLQLLLSESDTPVIYVKLLVSPGLQQKRNPQVGEVGVCCILVWHLIDRLSVKLCVCARSRKAILPTHGMARITLLLVTIFGKIGPGSDLDPDPSFCWLGF
jgi:hypothetical protein